MAHTFGSSSLEAEAVDLRGQPGEPCLENKTREGRKREKEGKKEKKKRKKRKKEEGE